MKKYLLIFISLAFLLSGCTLFVDKDTTDNISLISYKPVMTLKGDKIMSLKVGETYTEAGCDVTVGDSIYDYEIVSGNVDANTPGFYVVTYKSTNGYGWSSYKYRAVLVYDGDAYNRDIAGEYKFNNIISHATISKYSIPGYWAMDNVWGAAGIKMPIVFADTGDGKNFGVAPDEHASKGIYFGSARFKPAAGEFVFTIQIYDNNGRLLNNEFTWYPL